MIICFWPHVSSFLTFLVLKGLTHKFFTQPSRDNITEVSFGHKKLGKNIAVCCPCVGSNSVKLPHMPLLVTPLRSTLRSLAQSVLFCLPLGAVT